MSSMELSGPSSPVSASSNNVTSRRKSARAKQKPVLLQEEHYASSYSNGSNKRKRAELQRADVRATDPADLDDGISEESASDESDGDPHLEELKDKRKRRAPRPKKNPSKPAAKKLKTNNAHTMKLPVRPAINGTRKAPKFKKAIAQPSPAASDHETGLYGMLDSRRQEVSRKQHDTDHVCQPRYSPKDIRRMQLRRIG